ncbi:uncharacterized protein LOC135848885 [Planococcus citri]|uniref:uncharacterized protein LOC135848885 n=1 Tax=Planococcus citri TaxID=170843 RepID=UPI0031F73874
MCCCFIKSLFYFPLRPSTLIMLYLVELINILEFSTILQTGLTDSVTKHYRSKDLIFMLLISYMVVLGAQSFIHLVTIICLHFNERSVLKYSLLFGSTAQVYGAIFKFMISLKADQQNAFKELCEEAERCSEVIFGNYNHQKEAQKGCEFMTLIFQSDLRTLHLCFNILATLVFLSYLKFEVIRKNLEPTIWDACDVFRFRVAIEDAKEADDVSHKSGQKKSAQKNIASEVPTQPIFSGFGFRIMRFRIWCFDSKELFNVNTNQRTVEKFSATSTKITPSTPVQGIDV